jgi:hypothetical protein
MPGNKGIFYKRKMMSLNKINIMENQDLAADVALDPHDLIIRYTGLSEKLQEMDNAFTWSEKAEKSEEYKEFSKVWEEMKNYAQAFRDKSAE